MKKSIKAALVGGAATGVGILGALVPQTAQAAPATITVCNWAYSFHSINVYLAGNTGYHYQVGPGGCSGAMPNASDQTRVDMESPSSCCTGDVDSWQYFNYSTGAYGLCRNGEDYAWNPPNVSKIQILNFHQSIGERGGCAGSS